MINCGKHLKLLAKLYRAALVRSFDILKHVLTRKAIKKRLQLFLEQTGANYSRQSIQRAPHLAP